MDSKRRINKQTKLKNQQDKLKDNNLLFIIRDTVEKLNCGTWDDTKTIYNRLTSKARTADGLKARTADGLKSQYRLFMKDEATKKAVEKAVKEAEWVEKAKEVKELLQPPPSKADHSSLQQPSVSAADESTLWEPTPTRACSSTLIWQSYSPADRSVADSYTDTSSESSVSWSQSNAELSGTHSTSMLVSAGTVSAPASFAGMDAGISICMVPYCSFTGAAVADVGVDIPNESAANLLDTGSGTYAGYNAVESTPTCDSINAHVLSMDTPGTLEPMTTTASSYREASTLGFTPTNTPVYMQMGTHDLTAVPSFGPSAMNVLTNVATEGLDGTAAYTTNDTTTYPLRRGTIGAVNNPMIGAYYSGSTQWPVQTANHWCYGGDGYNMPHYHSVRAELATTMSDNAWEYYPPGYWSCLVKQDGTGYEGW